MTHRALLCLLCLGLALAGCEPLGFNQEDPRFCCTTVEACQRPNGTGGELVACGDGEICDNEGLFGASRTCVPDTSAGCFGPEDCVGDPGGPLCIDNACRACDATTGCDASAPVCDVGATYTCGGCAEEVDCAGYPATPHCGSGGGCVACRDEADCSAAAPICDAETQACRGCQADAECASGVCDEDASACLAEDQVIYVAPNGVAGTCTQAAPCLTITQGVAAVAGTRTTILVAPGSYVERVTIASLGLRLIGTGADLSHSGAGEVVHILGAASVTIEGLRIHTGLGPQGDGIRCADADGDSPTVALVGVTLEGNGGQGLDATACTVTVLGSTFTGNVGGGIAAAGASSVTVTRSAISGNNGAGIAATAGSSTTVSETAISDNDGGGISGAGGSSSVSRSTIAGNPAGGVSLAGGAALLVNNVISGNGGALTPFGGVKLDNVSSLTFAFNTIAKNQSSAAFAAGVQCSAVAALEMSNSIIVGDAADQLATTQCTVSYSVTSEAVVGGTGNLTDPPAFVNEDRGDFHLQATSPGVDAADPAATMEVDLDGDVRPQGARRDIGADEVRM